MLYLAAFDGSIQHTMFLRGIPQFTARQCSVYVVYLMNTNMPHIFKHMLFKWNAVNKE